MRKKELVELLLRDLSLKIGPKNRMNYHVSLNYYNHGILFISVLDLLRTLSDSLPE